MSAVRHIPKPGEPFNAERELLALRAEVQAIREDFDRMRELLEQARERNAEYRRVLAGALRSLKALDGC